MSIVVIVVIVDDGWKIVGVHDRARGYIGNNSIKAFSRSITQYW
jgi:hypothetical protein